MNYLHSGEPSTKANHMAFWHDVIIVDEAMYLYQSNYMHSFIWVLNKLIMKILSRMQTNTPNTSSSNFFVLILAIHFQISHFASYYIYLLERYFMRKQYITSVFLSMD